MRAADIRELLEGIGCWPPTCHRCGKAIGADKEIRFVATADKKFFAGVHGGCETGDVGEPSERELDARRYHEATGEKPVNCGGAYLTPCEVE